MTHEQLNEMADTPEDDPMLTMIFAQAAARARSEREVFEDMMHNLMLPAKTFQFLGKEVMQLTSLVAV
jgi:hypothetical protein